MAAAPTIASELGPVGWGDLAEKCRARYVRNLAALYRTNPNLAAQLDALPFTALPTLEPTRSGELTARLRADDGQPVYVHSRYDPGTEARRLVASQPAAGQVQDAGQDAAAAERGGRCFLLGGLGLGYHLAALERRFDRPRLVVAEDDPGLLKAALCATELDEPLHAGRLTFLTAADKAHVHAALRPIHTDVLLGLQCLNPPHAQRYHAGFQADVRRHLMDFLAFARLQMVTLLRNARITCKNVVYNLPAYLARPGVEVLAGRAQGLPAILVAAGPSLARDLDLLGALRDRAVIIAVQTVYKLLLARGIRPHFVTSLDFHELSANFFSNAGDPGGCILVAEPKATWHVLDAFPGRAHLLHNELVDDLLRAAAPRRAAIRAGSTVAHLAFYLAEHLGCDPIILVGQDLAFSQGLYYPPGMPIEQLWAPELGRFCTVEMKQWERIVRARPTLRTVKDVCGRDTYTDEQLFTYAEQFQSDFAASRSRVIQASESGMRLAGTRVQPLRQAAAEFCRRPLPADLFAAGGEPADPGLRAAGGRELRQRLDEVRALKGIATQTRELLGRLEHLTDKPAEFNRVVSRVDDLRARIQSYERTYKIVVGVSQLAELRRYSADRRLGAGEDLESRERARQRLRRDQEYVAAFIAGCEYWERLLPEAIARLGA